MASSLMPCTSLSLDLSVSTSIQAPLLKCDAIP